MFIYILGIEALRSLRSLQLRQKLLLLCFALPTALNSRIMCWRAVKKLLTIKGKGSPYSIIAKFHYTGPTGPDPTGPDPTRQSLRTLFGIG